MRIATVAGAMLMVTACGNAGPPDVGARGLYCVDDSQGCISERSAALSRMLADPKRSWVRQPAPTAAYASGVRLFAFKQRKRELSCDELVIGRKEADAGPQILRGPDGKALTLSQVSRGVMLSQEVSRELNTEIRRRCKA